MSTTIDTAFVNNYKSQLELKFQQMGSRLRPFVDVVPQNGEFDYYDQLGTGEAVERSTRGADTTYQDLTFTRRRLQAVTFDFNMLFDNIDKFNMLIDPRMGYAQTAAAALGRKMDNIIIAAATGTAYTGKTGATATAYDTNYQVAVNYVESGSTANSNLTIGKLRRARYLLSSNEAVMDGEPIVCALTASQEQALLRTTEVTSSEYNTVRALVNGEINSFLGMQFVRTQLLSKSGNNRSVLIFPKSAIKLGIAEDVTVRMDQLPGKNYSWQVFCEARAGAVRMWEEKVIEVLCDETA